MGLTAGVMGLSSCARSKQQALKRGAALSLVWQTLMTGRCLPYI